MSKVAYGFKYLQSSTAHGIGFQEEISPSLTTSGNQSVMISYGFEPGVAQRLDPERRFYAELSHTLRADAGDNQASAVIIKEVDNESTCDP